MLSLGGEGGDGVVGAMMQRIVGRPMRRHDGWGCQ